MMIYSGIFSAERNNHPIPSIYTGITEEESPSAGLSRAFSEIVRFNFKSAREYNPYGIRIFLFFAVQFFMRITGSIITVYQPLTKSQVLSDAAISSLLFIICFFPFLTFWKFM